MTTEIVILPISLYVDKPGRFEQYYYLPIKDRAFAPLSLKDIKYFVKDLFVYANRHPTLKFKMFYFETKHLGVAAKLFEHAPTNIRLPEEFLKVLGRESKTRLYTNAVVKQGLSTKKHAEYCLKLMDEFKPDLEEFINLMLQEAWDDGVRSNEL